MEVREFCMEFLGIQDGGLLDQLEQVCRIRKVPKGTVLVQTGERQSELAFLLSGLCRGYYVDSDGREVTDCFAYRLGDFVMCCYSLDDVSHITLESLEESLLFCISAHDVDLMMAQYAEVSRIVCKQLSRSLKMHWNSKIALTRLPATQRYQWFLETYPNLINLVKKKHVASFLNLTPQTLSQLRRNEKQQIGIG